MTVTTLDLFAGPGGWGLHEGIEIDQDVCATRRAAGLPTIQADVSRIQPSAVPRREGIVASAPCPPFSTGGPAAGRKDLELIRELMSIMAEGQDLRREYRQEAADPRSVLSVEPLRWVLAHKPDWTAWEQVPGALPLWEHAADLLVAAGYNVWVGLLDAADYGVPQNRKRAILMGHLTKLVSAPEPMPPVVMGDVLADVSLPADAVLQMGRSRGTKRRLDQPAPTIMFGKSPSGVAWYRPDGSAIRPIEIEEALLLQGFPVDYPLQGGKVSRFRQVGDAVPRGLATAIITRLES